MPDTKGNAPMPRQDSVRDQLRDVIVMAERMGCYDAADWIKTRLLTIRKGFQGSLDRCVMCRRRATGYAFIGDDRYCHGDDDPRPTCYERAQDPWGYKEETVEEAETAWRAGERGVTSGPCRLDRPQQALVEQAVARLEEER